MIIIPCKVIDHWQGDIFFLETDIGDLYGKECCFGIHMNWWFVSFQRNGTTQIYMTDRTYPNPLQPPQMFNKGNKPIMSALQDLGQANGMNCVLMKNKLESLYDLNFDNDQHLPDHWKFLKPFLFGASGNIKPKELNKHISNEFGTTYSISKGLFDVNVMVHGPDSLWESMLYWAAELYLR